MSEPNLELAREVIAAFNRRDLDSLFAMTTDDVVYDWSRSIGPQHGIYRGRFEGRAWLERFLDAWEEFRWDPFEISSLDDRTVLIVNRVHGRGRGSGVEVDARGVQIWTIEGGRLAAARLFQDRAAALRAFRIEAARVYFVCEGRPHGRPPDALLDTVLKAGVDVVQLREPEAGESERVVALAEPFRRAATAHGALFVLNDRPDLVADCDADGVHVGQEDLPVGEARRLAGSGAIVGLSTHSPAQLAAAEAARGEDRPDYLSVGPVWETPTKAGRPAAGLDYVRHAREHATLPWFAIGGIDAANVADVTAAGAERVVVVRAIRDAEDPGGTTRALREALEQRAPHRAPAETVRDG